jgi:hypothetical protein
MGIVPFPSAISACAVLAALRILSARATGWHFALTGENSEPGVRAISCRTGAVIRAHWTGCEWLILTAEPAVVGRSCRLITAFEQALQLTSQP